MPRADALIKASVFEPETFRAVTTAFDESWALVCRMFVGQPQAIIEEARSVLANAILNAATAGHTETDVLKQQGIDALKSAYPNLPI
jgi:hypothetical protein